MYTAITLVVATTLVISFLCSLWEAALLSIPPSRIEALRAEGNRGAKRLARLRADIDQPIAAILILNTVAHSAGAVWAGALVDKQFGHQWLTLFTVVLTLAILFISEIIPKTIGAVHATALAPRMAWSMDLLVRALWPLVYLCRGITHLLRHGAEPHITSEADILAMTRQSGKHGAILPEEARWVTNALKLNDVTARDLMTPRTVVFSMPVDLPIERVESHSAHWKHSRLPLVRDNQPDQVEGIVLRRDVFDALAADRTGITMRDLMKPALFVPETMTANHLIKTFIDARQHLAVVLDKFGGMEGVVTLEDVLEELLGEEIVDEHDIHVDMQEYARHRANQPQPPAEGSA